MSVDFLKRLLLFVAFVLAHALVLGHVHLFHRATPLLYVYFVTMFPVSTSRAGVLAWAFCLGLAVDIFSNTPGLAAASLTAIAAIQPYFLGLFVPRDAAETLDPSLLNLGPTKYNYYIVTLVTLYCLLLFTLEMFNFDNFVEGLYSVVGSSMLTLTLIFAFEFVRSKL